MMNPSCVSVVIPAYNASPIIAKTLTALQSQTFSNIEIIVVDDGSKDSTAEIVKAFPKINYLYQENAGPAAARNRGVQAASADIIFFTDSDCVPQKNWIEKILEGFSNENIGVVCGSYGIANPENLLARCIHKEIIYRHQMLMGEYPKVFGSYNFAVRKKVFEAAGGFDLSYRNASGEDNDLSYKILRSGAKIYFKKDALVDHYHTAYLSKYLREQYRHGFWRVLMYKKHPHMMKGDDYTFWKDILEPPTSYLIILSLLMSFIFSIDLRIFFMSIILLLTIEIFFGFLMTKNFLEGIYFGLVMFLRAFARTFGFSTGIIRIFIKKK